MFWLSKKISAGPNHFVLAVASYIFICFHCRAAEEIQEGKEKNQKQGKEKYSIPEKEQRTNHMKSRMRTKKKAEEKRRKMQFQKQEGAAENHLSVWKVSNQWSQNVWSI